MADDSTATTSQQQPLNSTNSSSALTSSKDSTAPSPSVARPPEARRQSSIRFSEDTSTVNRSPMSNRRRPSSDEITPIRGADNNTNRNYNTNAKSTSQPDGSADPSSKAKSTSGSERDTNEEQLDEMPWYKKIADKFGSVTLENKGSVARDHLALERTFLAWLRTSLAFASIGIAITQLFRLNTTIASRTQRYETSLNEQSDLPFSPFLGQTIPVELLPYLAQAISSAAATPTVATLGPTLLDQLLQLPISSSSDDSQTNSLKSIHTAAFDEEAAAKLRHTGKPLGATFLGISIVILIIGFHRYFESQYWIIRGKFPASRGSIFLTGFIAGSLILASLLVILIVAPTSYQKK